MDQPLTAGAPARRIRAQRENRASSPHPGATVTSDGERTGAGVPQVVLVRALAITILLLLAVLTYHVLHWRTIAGFVTAIDNADGLFADFVRHYHPMGREIFATKTPVLGYFYSPFFAILMAPLGAMDLESAALWWGGLQLVMMTLLLALPGIYFLRRAEGEYYVYLAACATSFPLPHNLAWGQVSVIVTVLILAALFCKQSHRPVAAGILLALGCSIKWYAVIFAIDALFNREWRFILSFGATLVFCLVAVPALLLGPHDTLHFYALLRQGVMEARGWMVVDPNSQYFVSVVVRLAHRLAAVSPNRAALLAIGWGVFAFNIVLVYGLARKRPAGGSRWAFALLFLSTPFIVSTSWPHYFVYLPFCQTLIAGAVWRQRWGLAKVLQGVVLVCSILLSSIVFFNLVGNWSEYSGYGVLFMSSLLLLLLAYSELFWQRRQLGRRDAAADGAETTR